MRSASYWVPILLMLGSCGSPPKPPAVDGSLKRPVNSALAVELQVCQGALQNTRIVASESGRLAKTAKANRARISACQQEIVALSMRAARASLPAAAATPAANSIFTIRFEYGKTRVAIPVGEASTLLQSARGAPLVLLRGRTDGTTDSAAESRIARARAAAVRDFLVGAGVDPARIRATYQPVGDHAADNSDPTGRAMNRRVEIEVYRTLPVAMGYAAAMS